jgi:hypothetical protein
MTHLETGFRLPLFSSVEDMAMAIEKQPYRVLERRPGFELRQYEPHIVAETLVSGGHREAANEGFRRLFAYIEGANRGRQTIPMTAPVNQEAAPLKIPMTAPVGQEKAGEEWRITFVMPAAATLETLPEPRDPRVKLAARPAVLMAALRYSGTWSRARYQVREDRLRQLIGQAGLKITGDPVWARYNSPFVPWFLRRNEVLIPVARVE